MIVVETNVISYLLIPGPFTALAEEAEPRLRASEQQRWLSRLELEHENLRAEDRLADVRGRVRRLVDDFKPDEILVNSALDYHPDHRAMHALTRELVDAGRYRGRVAEYPIWYLFDGPWAATADTLGLGERETRRLRREGLRLARELLELGALDLRG